MYCQKKKEIYMCVCGGGVKEKYVEEWKVMEI